MEYIGPPAHVCPGEQVPDAPFETFCLLQSTLHIRVEKVALYNIDDSV